MATLKQSHQQAESTAKIMKEKPKRQMTLCRGRAAHKGKHDEFYPDIRLQGKWLSDYGFRSGHVVDITCEDRKLTITITKEQRFNLD